MTRIWQQKEGNWHLSGHNPRARHFRVFSSNSISSPWTVKMPIHTSGGSEMVSEAAQGHRCQDPAGRFESVLLLHQTPARLCLAASGVLGHLPCRLCPSPKPQPHPSPGSMSSRPGTRGKGEDPGALGSSQLPGYVRCSPSPMSLIQPPLCRPRPGASQER